MNQLSFAIHFRGIAVSIALFLPAAFAAGQTTAPTTRPFSIYCNARPLESAQFSPNDLSQIFPAFKHADFDQSGFRAVVLPFLYSDPNNLGNPNEALAFSFLISNDIDWAPGSYATRHAYFTFKRDTPLMRVLAEKYDERPIVLAIAHWGSTYAVGGSITRSADGYSGQLQIFDHHARIAFQKSFQKPRPYFELLGDMDVAAISYFGPAPTDALIEFLHEPRCTNMSNIALLGSAAFMPQDSPQEFGVYDQILQTDPDFALVRYWTALRHFWSNEKEPPYYHQLALVLKSRLEPDAFEAFVPNSCPDKDLVAQFPAQVDHAEQLLGADHPMVLRARVQQNCWGKQSPPDVIARALKVAADFPNDHFLCTGLAYRFLHGEDVPADYELAASLYTANVSDNFQGATALTEWDSLWCVALVCDDMARPDVSMECLSLGGPKQPGFNLSYLIPALTVGGRYDEALQYYDAFGTSSKSDYLVPCAAFSAAVLNKPDKLDQIISDHKDVFEQTDLTTIFHGYSEYLHGHLTDVGQYTGSFDDLNIYYRWGNYLVAQLELDSGRSIGHYCQMFCYGFPQDRIGWQTLDAYFRQHLQKPTPALTSDAAAFYDCLSWFYPNDPWVGASAANVHDRLKGAPPVDVKLLKENLNKMLADGRKMTPISSKQWLTAATPWRVASAIHQLILQNKLGEAGDLAALNNRVQIAQHWQARESLSFSLMRKVDQARQSQ